MSNEVKLIKLENWLKETGRIKTWFAKQIGYSYQSLWCQMTGLSNLTDRFVISCFERFPDLPADVFEEHGYVRVGDQVRRLIPLNLDTNPAVPDPENGSKPV